MHGTVLPSISIMDDFFDALPSDPGTGGIRLPFNEKGNVRDAREHSSQRA